MYKSVTLLFPGQGSQHVGMGEKLKDSESYNLFSTANKILGFSISEICKNGPEEELKLTANAQPAIVTHSVALFQKLLPILKSKDVKISSVLGHSVGEYSALVAAGSLSFEDAVKAVNLRGKYMQEAVPAGKGKMIAIMKVPNELIEKACTFASNDNEKAMPANFNEPNQTVISGDKNACDRAVKWLEENIEGRFRAIELKVSAPFHSSLMEPAAVKLNKTLNEISVNTNNIPYIANIDAKLYESGSQSEIIKNNLYKQVCGSVRWSQSIAQLPSDTLCIEVGPGKVLAGLVRKINPDIKVISLDKDESFDELSEVL